MLHMRGTRASGIRLGDPDHVQRLIRRPLDPEKVFSSSKVSMRKAASRASQGFIPETRYTPEDQGGGGRRDECWASVSRVSL